MVDRSKNEEEKKDVAASETAREKGTAELREREMAIRRRRMKQKRLRRGRMMWAVLCLGMLALCVSTGILAFNRSKRKGQGESSALGKGTRGERVDFVSGEGNRRPARPMSEIVPKEAAEVRRPRLDIPKIGALYGIHIQDKGWSHYFSDHLYGMAPAGGYITAIRATLHNQPSDMTGTVQYQVNVSGKGWQDWTSDCQEAGDVAGGMHLEAVCMRLTGELADYYDVLYSVLQNNAWTDWVKNGEEAGQSGMGMRVDGIRISVVRKQADGVSYAGEIDPSRPMVALTYDDGPSQNATPRILAKLEECGGRATFFMVGSRAEKYDYLIRQMVEQGCEVANHTYDHTLMTKVAPAELESQLVRTNQVVYDAGGVTPVVMRPCGGATNDAGMVVAGTISMPAILWSVDTLDWKTKNAENTISTVLDNVRDGDIILMHDLYTATADASDVLIPELISRGYQLVTISELSSYRGGLLPGKSYSQFRP